MGKITKRSEHIEQACRVFGEHYRDILFKKWTFNHVIYPEDCCVHLVVDTSCVLNMNHLYDTPEEATKELRKILKDRLEKVLNKTDWISVQPFSWWVRGLENDT